jgi:osmotically-inducible protein OsmY
MKTNLLKLFGVVMTAAAVSGVCAFTAIASDVDISIEKSAQESYVFKNYLKDDAITVKSTEGVVILTGDVAEESHKTLAQETVANLPGVTSVDNQLVITGEIPAEDSDGWISMKVKTALLFHSKVNAFKTKVDVKEGVVTLTGEAKSEAQKDLAGEYAKDVSGVKEVKNEMTVAKVPGDDAQTLGEMIDDASITAQVKVALFFHQSTSAINTKVAVKDGVVTVSGAARNDAEKALVSKLVEDIKGVKSVVNDMTVEKK